MLITALSITGALVAIFTLGAIAGFIHETIRLVNEAEREALRKRRFQYHEIWVQDN